MTFKGALANPDSERKGNFPVLLFILSQLHYSKKEGNLTLQYPFNSPMPSQQDIPDEEYTVVAVFTSASIMDAQLDSVKEPLTVTGAMLGWRKAAFRGEMWLYWTEDRQPVKP